MRYFWLVIFVLSVGSVSAQNSARVRELEKQRKAALAEIEMTSQLLDETRQTARNSLNRLNLLSKQILSRKQVISLLNQEIGEIDKQIAASRRNISQLEKELGNKRQNYGKSVQSIYKRRSSQDKLLFILSADNFAQSLRRMRYLREYADWQKKQASEIIGKQKEIVGKQKELEKTRAEKNALLGAREDESRKLQTEESSQKEEVQQLNKKQKQLQADLKKKKKQADALNRQIEKQIAEEIARAEAEAHARNGNDRYAVGRRDRLADDGVGIDHITDLIHRGVHEIVERGLLFDVFHEVYPFFLCGQFFTVFTVLRSALRWFFRGSVVFMRLFIAQVPFEHRNEQRKCDVQPVADAKRQANGTLCVRLFRAVVHAQVQ